MRPQTVEEGDIRLRNPDLRGQGRLVHTTRPAPDRSICITRSAQVHDPHNRQGIFNAGMIPNLKENPRNRKTTKRGRKRLFNETIHALRMRVERTFAWEDKSKRLLLRFERVQQRHYGMKLMAYTLLNLREFCGV